MRVLRGWRLVIPSLVVAAAVAACGGSGSGGGGTSTGAGASSSAGTTSATGGSASNASSGGPEMTKINLNIIPIPDLAPVYVAMKEGYFTKEHLKPSITLSPGGGPAVIPAVVSGKAQFGAPAWSDLILAVSKGLPLVGVASSDAAGPTNATDYQYLVTTQKSGISSLGQLAGKTIAINSLDGLGQVEADAALANAGADYKSVHYVAINFPQQGTAMTAGRVDGAQMVEPFITQLQGQTGIHKLAGLDYAVAPKLPVAVFLTSKSYYESHLDVVHRFQTAIRDAQEYITAHPDVARSVVPEFTGVPASLAKKILMPYYPPKTNIAGVQAMVDAMKKYGIITKAPPLSSFVKVAP